MNRKLRWPGVSRPGKLPFHKGAVLRLIAVLLGVEGLSAVEVDRDVVLEALEKAGTFYAERASIQGGYHDQYATDLSVARSSKRSQGREQISVTGSATPSVGMAFLVAWHATADSQFLEAAQRAGMALIRGQLCSGGWDYSIHLDPETRVPFRYRLDLQVREPMNVVSSGYTNLDNNATQGAIRFLMRLDRELNFQDRAIHEGALFALRGLARGQYENGAWPQRYQKFPAASDGPARKASFPESWSKQWPGRVYYGHATINDECTLNMIDVMLEAHRIYGKHEFWDSAIRGGEFLLRAQLPDPQPAWAQQYDREMHPAWGRQFEPPAVSGRESLDVIRTLLLLYRETGEARFLSPIPRAIGYFRRSRLDASMAPDPEVPLLARFYEMRTNRPLFVRKGTRLEVQTDSWWILDGYEPSYDDSNSVTHYTLKIGARALDELEAEFNRVQEPEVDELRRPAVLNSMTPWRHVGGNAERPVNLAVGVRAIIEQMDTRGAWVQAGQIGRAPRVLSVTPGRRMVLTVGAQTLVVEADQAVQLFEGTEAPIEEVIYSGTFNRNVRMLAEYLQELDGL